MRYFRYKSVQKIWIVHPNNIIYWCYDSTSPRRNIPIRRELNLFTETDISKYGLIELTEGDFFLEMI